MSNIKGIMQAYKLKIYLEDYEDKLYREILFNYSKSINILAFSIISIFNYSLEVSCSFFDEDKEYDLFFACDNILISNLKLKNNQFKFKANGDILIIEIIEQINVHKEFILPHIIDGVGNVINDKEYSVLNNKKFNPDKCYKKLKNEFTKIKNYYFIF